MIITIAEAAELCGKSQKTVRRAVAAGKLKSTKIQNKTRIEKADFDEWVKNGCCGTEEQDNTVVRNDEVNWIDISDEWKIDGWKKKKDRNGYNFIDLFSGAGGLSCGLVILLNQKVSKSQWKQEILEKHQLSKTYMIQLKTKKLI